MNIFQSVLTFAAGPLSQYAFAFLGFAAELTADQATIAAAPAGVPIQLPGSIGGSVHGRAVKFALVVIPE